MDASILMIGELVTESLDPSSFTFLSDIERLYIAAITDGIDPDFNITIT